MSENPKRFIAAIDTLSEFVQQDLLNASRGDLHAIAREWGIDPITAPQSVDDSIKKAVQKVKLKKLHAAKAQRDVELTQLATIDVPVPKSREELLVLIADLLSSLGSDSQGQMTIQHRNLKEQTEEDLEGLARQLIAIRSTS
jgi:hypothetical protein